MTSWHAPSASDEDFVNDLTVAILFLKSIGADVKISRLKENE